jgi:hypothetical protein
MKSKSLIVGVTAIGLAALMVSVGLVASGVFVQLARGGPNPQIQFTYLLFPLLINQNQFDTEIYISNTSADPFNTTPEPGSCTIHFYGSGAPSSPFSTGTIAPGTSYTAGISVIAPGFAGYAIANCNFRYAHGVAFLEQRFQEQVFYPGTYLALVIKTPRLNDENLNN